MSSALHSVIDEAPEVVDEALEARVDQDLCTGDGICVQLAPEVFELDIDGLAYVKGDDGELLTQAGAAACVPVGLVLEVLQASEECPGECIHVTRVRDGQVVAGPAG